MGTHSGYKLYEFTSVDRLNKLHEMLGGDACIVERLFSSSLVAVVGSKQRTKLRVYHFKKETEICNYSYSNKILNVKLNRQRLIVVLEDNLFIHSIKDMKVIHTIRDTPPNPSGVCAFSSSSERSYLAYPGSSQVGEVQIFDTVNLQSVTMIQAHDSPLAALAFSFDGTKLATASEKGTVIRVFKSDDGAKLFEFRRGVKRYVEICCLAFSQDAVYLCASSNTETVHIFKLEAQKETHEEEPQGWMGYISKALATPASYLPTQVTDVFTQGRSFAMAHLEKPGQKNICAIAIMPKIPRLLVVTADGIIHMYNINPAEGGECVLVKEHNLLKLDGEESDPIAELESQVSGLAAGTSTVKSRPPLEVPPSDPVSRTAVAGVGQEPCRDDGWDDRPPQQFTAAQQ